MRVGDRDGERVGGVGAGDLGPGQQARHHRMDLRLARAASPDHRLLDQRRGILPDRNPGSCRAHQNDAARLAELEGRLRVLVDEYLLDRGRFWPVLGDDRLELLGQPREPLRQRGQRVGLDLAIGAVGKAVAVGFDQPPAGRAEPGVEAEDPQASFSSSSSGTS